MELQEDINKLVEWANKWQMSFNVDKIYYVMHIEHNNMQRTNDNMYDQQLPVSSSPKTLEHAVQFWSPHLRRDIDKMEKIQRRATKMIPQIRNHSYHQRI